MFEGGWLHSPCIGYWGRGVGEGGGGEVLDEIPGHLGKLGHHRENMKNRKKCWKEDFGYLLRSG